MTRLALIGAGRWGTNILRTLTEIGGVTVTVLEQGDSLNPDAPRLRGIRGVLIATPASTHARIARPFLERGVATFVEKPLTTRLADAVMLQRTAHHSGALLFTGHVHLYNPAFLTTKRLARHAGRIRYLLAEGANNGPFRDDISALWDWAPHDLSMALDLLGMLPVAAQAWGVTTLRPRTALADLATYHLRFPQGAEMIGTASWLAPEKRRRLMLVGARSTIVLDDTAAQKVTLYQHLGPTIRGRRVQRHDPVVAHPPYGSAAPLAEELRAFLRAIGGIPSAPADPQYGVGTIRILEALERSMARGGAWVRLTGSPGRGARRTRA